MTWTDNTWAEIDNNHFEEEEELGPADPFSQQIGGNHYKQYRYQPIVFFLDFDIHVCLANAIKYLTRIGTEKDAGGVGIDKAKHYVNMYHEYYIDDIPKLDRKLRTADTAEIVEKFMKQFYYPVDEAIDAILDLQFVNTDDYIESIKHPAAWLNEKHDVAIQCLDNVKRKYYSTERKK